MNCVICCSEASLPYELMCNHQICCNCLRDYQKIFKYICPVCKSSSTILKLKILCY